MFCIVSYTHGLSAVSGIRQLQCILLKVALLVGVEVHVNVAFEGLIEPPEEQSTSKSVSVRISRVVCTGCRFLKAEKQKNKQLHSLELEDKILHRIPNCLFLLWSFF